MHHDYVLEHVHTFEDGEEDVKLIGVYSTQENAEAAVRRLSTAPGFASHPDGFSIDCYEFDRDHWTQGFISRLEAMSSVSETKS